MQAHLLQATQPGQRVVEPRVSRPHPLPQQPRPHLCLWPRLLLLLLLAAQPSPESTDSRGRGGTRLLHPLFLEADEALVDHVHRQILVGQSCFHFTQDGGASWGQVGHGGGVSTGRAGAASAPPSPLARGRAGPAQRCPPRSAATALPLVTTNSCLLRDGSSSQPAGCRLERAAVCTSTTTANSAATQDTLPVKCSSPRDKAPPLQLPIISDHLGKTPAS